MTEEVEIRSEEVQEILTKTPHWIIRSGSGLFLFALTIVFCLSWYIQYPDIVSSKVLITTKIPIQKEYAQYTLGFDSIYVSNSQKVRKDEILAVIENKAETEHVYYLKSILDTIRLSHCLDSSWWDGLPILYLGEVEAEYLTFKNNFIEYGSGPFAKNLSVDLSSKNPSLMELVQTWQRMPKDNSSENRIKQEMESLKDLAHSALLFQRKIDQWEHEYIIKADYEGNVVFVKKEKQNQKIEQGELIFSILPTSNQEYVGELRVPSQNLGKIKEGQKVNIKLDNYPDDEFGVLQGRISNVSWVPDGAGDYLVEVELSKNLITSYGKRIDFKYEMKGTAEVVTEDLRFLERVFSQFKNILKP